MDDCDECVAVLDQSCDGETRGCERDELEKVRKSSNSTPPPSE
ncbi:MAG: hypothetical protein PHQ81_10000 [Methanofollis sp.]|nr:hypothetical protein [Methanofollis sp.]